MKKTITLLLIVVLTLCLFAGCRSGTTPEDMATDASEAIEKMIPRSDNANPTDGDGFIGDDNAGANHGNGNNRNGGMNGNPGNGINGNPGNGGMMPNG